MAVLVTEARVSFPCPPNYPTTGAADQEFRVQVRKVGAGFDPTVAVELWEKGSFVATVVAATAVSSTTGVVVSGTWGISSLSNVSGHDVECRVVGDGFDDGALEIGAIEWNASVDTATNKLLCGYTTPSSSMTLGDLTIVGEPPALQGRAFAASTATATLTRRTPLVSTYVPSFIICRSVLTVHVGPFDIAKAINASSGKAALTVTSPPKPAVVVRTRTFYEHYRDTGWEDWR